MSYDFVVIGAGISGIASALALAKNGLRVALLEKADRTAPLLRGFSRQGVHFDTGFHYTGGLGPGEPLDIFFRYLGLSDAIESYPFDESGFDVFHCAAEGFEFRFPYGYELIRRELCAAFPGERPAIESYLARIRSVCAALPYQNLDAPMASEILLQRVFGPTLKETLDSLTGNALLKSLLSMHTLLYGVCSAEVSFVQHAVVVGNYYQSASGIRGGGLSLARACDARLAALGVDVFCGCEATGIETDSQGACAGVRLAGGETLESRGCIATLHPRLLLDLVPDRAFRPAYRKRLAALEDTTSAFLAYAVCAEPIPSLAGANRFLLPNAACIHEIGKTGSAGEAPLYRSGAYRHFKRQALDRMRRQIERLSPDLAGGMRTLEGSTPLTIRDFCNTPEGGLYGVKHMVGQYNPLPATRMKGLYLAGQALVSPGVMGAMLSGLLACGTILGHDHMREELKACC